MQTVEVLKVLGEKTGEQSESQTSGLIIKEETTGLTVFDEVTGINADDFNPGLTDTDVVIPAILSIPASTANLHIQTYSASLETDQEIFAIPASLEIATYTAGIILDLPIQASLRQLDLTTNTASIAYDVDILGNSQITDDHDIYINSDTGIVKRRNICPTSIVKYFDKYGRNNARWKCRRVSKKAIAYHLSSNDRL